MSVHPCNDQPGDWLREHFPAVYLELKRIADAMIRPNTRIDVSRSTVVHDAYIRLQNTADGPNAAALSDAMCNGNARGYIAAALRNALRDRVRALKAERRGGGVRPQELRESGCIISDPDGTDPFDLLMLDDALTWLAQRDSLGARVIELRFFAGMTFPEIEAETSCSDARHILRRSLQAVRAYLAEPT